MRLMLTLLLALNSCAPVAVAASSPATYPAPCLDVQGQRELIAGVELEAGEQAAALARCNIQRGAAVKYGDAQASRADTAETRTAWVSALVGIGGAAVAAAVTVGLEALANAHKPPPAPAQGAP